MASWNNASSYANCIKLYRLGLTTGQVDAAWEMLEAEGWWDTIRWPIDDFTNEHQGDYTVGINGRSGGEVVLYRSAFETTNDQSYCTQCGQRNFRSVTEDNHHCGVCRGERRNYLAPPRQLVTYPGRELDQGTEFDEWSTHELRERVCLITSFDKACDQIRSNFIDLLDSCSVVEQTVMVPKIVKRLTCRA